MISEQNQQSNSVSKNCEQNCNKIHSSSSPFVKGKKNINYANPSLTSSDVFYPGQCLTSKQNTTPRNQEAKKQNQQFDLTPKHQGQTKQNTNNYSTPDNNINVSAKQQIAEQTTQFTKQMPLQNGKFQYDQSHSQIPFYETTHKKNNQSIQLFQTQNQDFLNTPSPQPQNTFSCYQKKNNFNKNNSNIKDININNIDNRNKDKILSLPPKTPEKRKGSHQQQQYKQDNCQNEIKLVNGINNNQFNTHLNQNQQQQIEQSNNKKADLNNKDEQVIIDQNQQQQPNNNEIKQQNQQFQQQQQQRQDECQSQKSVSSKTTTTLDANMERICDLCLNHDLIIQKQLSRQQQIQRERELEMNNNQFYRQQQQREYQKQVEEGQSKTKFYKEVLNDYKEQSQLKKKQEFEAKQQESWMREQLNQHLIEEQRLSREANEARKREFTEALQYQIQQKEHQKQIEREKKLQPQKNDQEEYYHQQLIEYNQKLNSLNQYKQDLINQIEQKQMQKTEEKKLKKADLLQLEEQRKKYLNESMNQNLAKLDQQQDCIQQFNSAIEFKKQKKLQDRKEDEILQTNIKLKEEQEKQYEFQKQIYEKKKKELITSELKEQIEQKRYRQQQENDQKTQTKQIMDEQLILEEQRRINQLKQCNRCHKPYPKKYLQKIKKQKNAFF